MGSDWSALDHCLSFNSLDGDYITFGPFQCRIPKYSYLDLFRVCTSHPEVLVQ